MREHRLGRVSGAERWEVTPGEPFVPRRGLSRGQCGELPDAPPTGWRPRTQRGSEALGHENRRE